MSSYSYNTTSSSWPASSVTISASGSGYTMPSNSYLTSTGSTTSSTITWTQPNQNFVSNNGKPVMSIPHDGTEVILEKEATLRVKGSVVINGIDLEERIKTIEKVLHIPQRDVIMESKYPKLKELHDEYMRELDKYTTWEKLK